VLLAAERNHRSWFGRDRELVTIDSVDVFLGLGDAVIAFPGADADLAEVVRAATGSGAREVGCWSLQPDEALGQQLLALGFQDGWQPHWLGFDLRRPVEEPQHPAVETLECSSGLPYWSPRHERVIGGDVHHFTVGDDGTIVGHAVLNVDGDCGGIYDMAVAPVARRRGFGSSLTLAALSRARELGCTSVTLNATGEGEPMYRSVGLESLGRGMTWWLFPRA
jgi:GNAT superfamily N-acetyltransferase